MFPKVASTVFAVGDAVTFNGSGQVAPAVAATTTGIVGICKKAVAATDSDYAANTPIAIDVNLSADSEFEIDANGTVTAAMVGLYKDIITNAGTMAIAAATNNHFIVTGLGSTTTKARVRVNLQSMVA